MENEKKGLSISVKSYISSLLVILVLMIVTYALTFVIPGGQYARIQNADGDTVIDMESYTNIEGGLPFWKFILSPFLVLGSDSGTTIIAVIIFLIVIGGIFGSLSECKLMDYMLKKIVFKFGASKYKLMAVLIGMFMLLGSFVGSFEEVVPLVPIVVGLSIALGWDAITGVGMSIVAVGFGFAAGIMNPFTVGVAQRLAGVPMFSGVWLRIVSFVLIYSLITFFLYRHAKKVEKPVDVKREEFVADPVLDKALLTFVIIMLVGIALIISSIFITALQDYTMIIVAIMFLVAGVSASLVANLKGKRFFKAFGAGLVSLLPAVILILMASSIRYVLEEGKILDTILHFASDSAKTLPKVFVILFIYLIALVMNFFIASGSAKAFLLIPILVPVAAMFGISPNLCIVAFAFGDGFSNVLYPTNPVLLISLGLANTSYKDYIKWAWKLQLANLILTSLILVFGWAICY